MENSPSSTPVPLAEEDPEVFYHIFVRSFRDSNQDQHGDLQGIIDGLDYLQELGVTSILLTPLYPSKFYHNYFADRFEGIDAEFGDMATYAKLVKEIHDRGMKIYMDQEIQYVTGQHEWFTDSYKNPASQFDEYILFSDEQNTTPVATLLGTTDFYVWPNQYQNIYTVNMHSEKVRDYFRDYLLFWMDPDGDGDFADGVDGFRIDHMMDDLDNVGVLTDLFEKFWVPIFNDLRDKNAKIKIIAEQADWGYGEDFFERGEVDMVFSFPIWGGATKLNAADLAEAITKSNQVVMEGRDQLVFIENHDTDRFAGEGRNTPDILRLGAAINLLVGWTPSIYYGQELGMTGERNHDLAKSPSGKSNADAHDIPLRQAFRWQPELSAAENADWYRLHPEAYSAEDSNVPGDGVSLSEQDKDPASLLNYYRQLAKLRGDYPVLANGKTKVLSSDNDVLVLERQTSEQRAVVIFNLSDQQKDIPLSLGQSSLGNGWQNIHGEGQVTDKDEMKMVSIAAHKTSVWVVK